MEGLISEFYGIHNKTTTLPKKAKTLKASGSSGKTTSSCKWPIGKHSLLYIQNVSPFLIG